MNSSRRPRTPPRSSYSTQPASDQAEPAEKSKPVDNFLPHVFDLIYPIREATSLRTKYVPPVFHEAEAVDSSVLLGEGASFSASLQAIPEGPKTIQSFAKLGGLEITSSSPAPERPKFVVYKTARVAFDEEGYPLPKYSRAMQSVLTEFHTLTYPPLQKHANIINFLGFAWGSNPFSPLHRLPAVMVEYAEHGTLADLLARNKVLSFEIKHILCLDSALGLQALHLTGLVHGDVKPENILVCSAVEREYIAKVADFGFSIVQAAESEEMWIGGTRPWMAPEILKRSVRVRDLLKTDIYSFGLLAWRICIDGRSPHDFLSESGATNMTIEDFEKRKADGSILAMANGEAWFERYAHTKCDAKVDAALDLTLQALRSNNFSAAGLKLMEDRRAQLQAAMFKSHYDPMLGHQFVGHLRKVFQKSLQLDIAQRDLESIIKILQYDLVPPSGEPKNIASPTTGILLNHRTAQGSAAEGSPQVPVLPSPSSKNPQMREDKNNNQADDNAPADQNQDLTFQNSLPLPSWALRGFKTHWYSWQKVRDLEPSVQQLAFRSFSEKHSSDLFILSALYMNGYGCISDPKKALACLQRSADLGYNSAQAFIWRVYSASSKDTPSGVSSEYLYLYAVGGSQAALEDLRIAEGEERYLAARSWLRNANCGVGAPWLDRNQMLGGYTQSQWFDDDWCIKQVQGTDRPADLVINKRGDTVLHFTAMCGRWKPFTLLITDYDLHVDSRNPLGETPLLAACRAGQATIAILCLQRYNANASLAADNGETPLHWLVSFDDEVIEPLTRDLLEHGASINAATPENIKHTVIPSMINMNIRQAGTPLSWAVQHNRAHIVRVLLRNGADPHWTSDKVLQSALNFAAYFHHDECLRIIIIHLEEKAAEMQQNVQFAVFYGPVVKQAFYGADKFSMILRHGANYQTRLHATLDLLREKTKLANFSHAFEGSPLYHAVSEAHDEVVEYMLKHGWYTETMFLNMGIGEAKRTPILEAVRWNRPRLARLLLDYRADLRALAANPFRPDQLTWSALHIFAHEGHDKDLGLVQTLVREGLSVDGMLIPRPSRLGRSAEENLVKDASMLSLEDDGKLYSCETPFAIALRHNAFNLTSTLLTAGADPNALTFSSGLFASVCPLTVLGHIIVSNARYSSARLRYLLNIEQPPVNFVVDPERKMTALHQAAMGHVDVKNVEGENAFVRREEFDSETNTDILAQLLLKWNSPKEVNALCGIKRSTALHLAVVAGSIANVQALLRAGADRSIVDEEGKTALMTAEERVAKNGGDPAIVGYLR